MLGEEKKEKLGLGKFEREWGGKRREGPVVHLKKTLRSRVCMYEPQVEDGGVLVRGRRPVLGLKR